MQLLPIKLVPGYIAIDFVAGCIDCNFCVAKRDTSIKKIFESREKHNLCSSDKVHDLLNEMPSYKLARIPLRIGNDIDYVFQKTQTQNLIELLPKDYPIIVLTRFPLTEEDRTFFKSRRNVLLKITITPESNLLHPKLDIKKVVRSLEKLNCKHVITFGPLVEDNVNACFKLIEQINFPKNSYVYLKSLDRSGLPWIQHIKEPSQNAVSNLENLLIQKKVRHLTMILCPLFEELERADPRVVDIPEKEKKNCLKCNSYKSCYRSDNLDERDILMALREIGIEGYLSKQEIGYKTVILDVGCKTAIGDESFVSYTLGQKIRFKNTIKGLFDEDVSFRWNQCGFFPIDKLLESKLFDVRERNE